MRSNFHQPVLLEAVIQSLLWDPSGCYLEGTFGRGGHARALLHHLIPAQGRLISMDCDPEAEAAAALLKSEHFFFKRAKFSTMSQVASAFEPLSGVFLDLGLCSTQLDNADRGFSFMREGPLDMRMDNRAGITAAEWLATVSERTLRVTFSTLGEERYAARVARAIVAARRNAPLRTTTALATLIAQQIPTREQHQHPATRIFQAIRMHINEELSELALGLQQAIALLKPEGRLAVITFHGGEARVVKAVMRRAVQAGVVRLFKKIEPTAQERGANPRARSAILRVAQRTALPSLYL